MTTTTHGAPEVLPWHATGRPATPQGWMERAEEVATILGVDAADRHRAGDTPDDRVGLLKQAGLVTLLGPVARGGAGEGWGTAYAVVRRVCEGDPCTGRLLGYHYLWSQLPALLGTAGQAEDIIGTATCARWFFGGAVDPRDADLVAVDAGRDLVFSGTTTGCAASDVTWLRAAVAGHTAPVLALAPSDHPGITFHRPDPGGRRPGDGDGLTVQDLVLPWRSALGWVDKDPRGRTDDSLTLATLRLVLANLDLGIAAGALRTAPAAVRHRTGSGPDGGDAPDRAVDDRYVGRTLGDLRSGLRAAQALADRAGDAIELLHIDPDGHEPRARGEAAVLVAAAQRSAAEVGARIGGPAPG